MKLFEKHGDPSAAAAAAAAAGGLGGGAANGLGAAPADGGAAGCGDLRESRECGTGDIHTQYLYSI